MNWYLLLVAVRRWTNLSWRIFPFDVGVGSNWITSAVSGALWQVEPSLILPRIHPCPRGGKVEFISGGEVPALHVNALLVLFPTNIEHFVYTKDKMLYN